MLEGLRKITRIQTGYTVSWPRTEPGISRIGNSNHIHSIVTFGEIYSSAERIRADGITALALYIHTSDVTD
jgi:hypothetical protein